jgi:hypothetical protein
MFALPFADGRRAPSWWACVLVAAGCGAVSAAVLPPPAAPVLGAAVAVLSLAGLRFAAGRAMLALCGLGCLLATGALTVLEEARYHYPAGSSWPHNFESAGVLAFLAVVALASGTAVELARRHRTRVDEAATEGSDHGLVRHGSNDDGSRSL